MFTPHLYDHRFDIDDLICALCGDDHPGLWHLNSRDGTLMPVADSSIAPDGADDGHHHNITPLPPSFLTEMRQHPRRRNLSADDVARLDSFLDQCRNMHACLSFFNEGTAGGWLRERIKEEALEWLDLRGMIPPSMRHAWKTETTPVTPTSADKAAKIKIRIDPPAP